MMQVVAPRDGLPGVAPAPAVQTLSHTQVWEAKRTKAVGAVTLLAIVLALLIVVRRGPEAMRRPNPIVIGAILGLAAGFDLRVLMSPYDVLDPIGLISTVLIAAVGGGVGSTVGWALGSP